MDVKWTQLRGELVSALLQRCVHHLAVIDQQELLKLLHGLAYMDLKWTDFGTVLQIAVCAALERVFTESVPLYPNLRYQPYSSPLLSLSVCGVVWSTLPLTTQNALCVYILSNRNMSVSEVAATVEALKCMQVQWSELDVSVVQYLTTSTAHSILR